MSIDYSLVPLCDHLGEKSITDDDDLFCDDCGEWLGTAGYAADEPEA